MRKSAIGTGDCLAKKNRFQALAKEVSGGVIVLVVVFVWTIVFAISYCKSSGLTP